MFLFQLGETTYDLLLKSARLVDPLNGIDSVCDVACADGVIAEIAESIDSPRARQSLNLTGKTIMPGIIDMHTHANCSGTSACTENGGFGRGDDDSGHGRPP